MKSVCILVQSVYDFDPRVRRKAEALAAAGYMVDVLALRAVNGKKNYVLNGVNVYTLSLGKKRGSLLRYAFEYAAFFVWAFVRVPLLMRSRRYLAVDVNTLPDFLIFAPVMARWMGAKLILDMHEITPEFYMSKYGISESSWLVRLLKWQEKRSFDFADRVITINQPILDLFIGRGLQPSKASVVMNAVDESKFTNAARATGVPAPVADRFVMMYHGTLTSTYGLDVAVEAFGMAHERLPGAEIWILGSGPEQGPLAELARQRGVGSKVKLIGQVPSSEIPGWLSQCDAGILPFRRDVFLDFAFPNKLPEFIVMGKPVLISRLRAIRHYFGEESLAYFEPNNPSDFAEQMVRVYRDRELRAGLAANATREYAPIRWDLMKRRYLSLLDELVPARAVAAQAETTPVRDGLRS
jgi:glycosyltransferase involved in cell wall biosynthesis